MVTLSKTKPDASMHKRRHSGFTLIELVIFIVVIAVGLTGILSVMNTTVLTSGNPMIRKQCLMLADSIMEEILHRDFQDTNNAANATEPEAGGHNNWDDVNDYNGAVVNATNFNDIPEVLRNNYQVNIIVAPGQNIGNPSVAATRVTVTVSRGQESITLTGYRTDF